MKTVLFFDQLPINDELLRLTLENRGVVARVAWAKSVDQAKTLFKQEHPDLVLVGCMTKNGHAMEFVRLIKASNYGGTILAATLFDRELLVEVGCTKVVDNTISLCKEALTALS